MVTNINLGKITSAIQQGRAAYENIDFGPSMSLEITNIESPSADWGVQTLRSDIFIAGVHKWGDTTLRVAK